MSNQVFLVFQDCINCEPVASQLAGDHELAEKLGVTITPMPFFKAGAPELIRKASKAKVSLPFFSDGKKCAKHLTELVEDEQEEPKTAKIKKRKE